MNTKHLLLFLILLLFADITNAQFLDRLGKSAQRAAERTVEKRVEKETEKKTDKTMDEVFEPGEEGKKEEGKKKKKQKDVASETADQSEENSPAGPDIAFNYDFEPGNVSVFEDNFSKDRSGDFPAKWDTNGSGEIVIIDGAKWLRLTNNSIYIPMAGEELPDDYTITFDLLTKGLDNGTSSQAFIKLLLHDNNSFKDARTYAMVELSPCQFITSPGVVVKHVNGDRQLRNNISKDYRKEIIGKSRISIAVNKTRMRVWLNENKLVDVPRLVPEGISNFKIKTVGLRDDKNLDEVYIKDFKMAKSGADYRSKLLTEGKLSTNAILFKTGSATIASGAESIIPEIAEAMNQEKTMTLLIVGHTDDEGSFESNFNLSQKRAEAVKTMLIDQYQIKADRIRTQGKGESEPLKDNSTAAGKAENRRVEFIKL